MQLVSNPEEFAEKCEDLLPAFDCNETRIDRRRARFVDFLKQRLAIGFDRGDQLHEAVFSEQAARLIVAEKPKRKRRK